MLNQALAKKTYAEIKQMILLNEIKPGELVNERQMQKELSYGRTPVREAFIQLAADDLVTIHPRKGIEISQIDPKKLYDIYVIRSIIEPEILGNIVGYIDLDKLKQMREEFLKDISKPAGINPITNEEILEGIILDRAFHALLVDSVSNDYLTKMMSNFFDYLTMVRVAVTFEHDRYVESNKEHINIINAIIEGKILVAKDMLKVHLKNSHDLLIDDFISPRRPLKNIEANGAEDFDRNLEQIEQQSIQNPAI